MAKKKKVKIRTGARTASKVQEKELISKAKKILKNPELVIPKCEHEGRCHFDRIRRQISRIRSVAKDEKKLARLAKTGDQIARAYAATILLTHSEKAPYLAVFKTPYGEVAYALRGKVKKEKLIGVQNYDKPKWKLLSVMDLAKKKGLHIYSSKKGMICIGRESKPPDFFVKEMLDSLKYNLKKEGNVYMCEHVSKSDMGGSEDHSNTFIKVNWKSSGTKIGVCTKCASKKSNIVASITQNMAIPKPEDDFDIDVKTSLNCKSECDSCTIEKHIDIDDTTQKAYFNGAISDNELAQKHLLDFEEYLKNEDKILYILDDACFGDDRKAFLDALKPNEEERKGLEAILQKVEIPVVVSKATPNKVLSLFWEEQGKKAILAIVGDEETAEKLFESADTSKTSPSQVLRDAKVFTKDRDIISALPTYNSLPAIAKFADNIARIYMTQGREDSIRAIERYKGGDTRIKSVAYAFLLALGQGASKKWQYTKTEIDFANFLKEHAHKLLNSQPEEYHENLQKLLSSTGSTKKLTLG